MSNQQKQAGMDPKIAEVWKLFKETDRNMKETDRKMKENTIQIDKLRQFLKESSERREQDIKSMKETSQETDRQMKETAIQMKETDRAIKEMSQETDRQMKETDRAIKEMSQETDRKMQETAEQMREMSQETDRRMRETDRRMKELNKLFIGQWGKLMEVLVDGDLVKLLQQKNIQVTQTTTNTKGTHKGKYWEFDIIAKNGEEVVIVEVKTTLSVQDVNDFIDKVKTITPHLSECKDKKVYGAMAYLKSNGSSHIYAEKQGLFVIRAVGSSASIVNTKSFKPKVF